MVFPHTEVAPIVSSFLDTTSRHTVNQPVIECTYLEMVETPASSDNVFAEISLTPQKRVIDVETIQYDALCKRSIIDEIESLHGINYVKNSASALYDQMVNDTEIKLFNIYKEAGEESQNMWLSKWQVWCNKKFGITYPKYIDITEEGFTRKLHAAILTICNKTAVKSRRGPANFLVGNTQIISHVMDIPGFEPFVKKDKTVEEGTINLVGQLGDIKVFANPLLKWNDNTLVMGRMTKNHDPGLYFIEHDKTVDVFHVTDSDRVILKVRQSLASIGNTYKNAFLTRKIVFDKEPFLRKLFKLIVR